jgi:hypothetical protein
VYIVADAIRRMLIGLARPPSLVAQESSPRLLRTRLSFDRGAPRAQIGRSGDGVLTQAQVRRFAEQGLDAGAGCAVFAEQPRRLLAARLLEGHAPSVGPGSTAQSRSRPPGHPQSRSARPHPVACAPGGRCARRRQSWQAGSPSGTVARDRASFSARTRSQAPTSCVALSSAT